MIFFVENRTWRDILDIFGDGSEYAWALTQGVDNIDLARSHHEDEDEDEEGGYEKKRKPQVAKDIKLSDIYEPAEIKKKLLTEEDELIRIKDIPERFQVFLNKYRNTFLTFTNSCVVFSKILVLRRYKSKQLTYRNCCEKGSKTPKYPLILRNLT